MTEQQFYDQAAAEFRDNAMDTGLWARAMSEVDGDEAQARERYIAMRVDQLAQNPAGVHEADPAAAAGRSSGAGGGRGRILAYAGAAVAALAVVLIVIWLAQ